MVYLLKSIARLRIEPSRALMHCRSHKHVQVKNVLGEYDVVKAVSLVNDLACWLKRHRHLGLQGERRSHTGSILSCRGMDQL